MRAALLASAMSDLYAEPRCREAWRDFGVPPTERVQMIQSRCTEAYCPLLSEPRPEMCNVKSGDLPREDRNRLWAELQARILERDLGHEGAVTLARRLQKPMADLLSGPAGENDADGDGGPHFRRFEISGGADNKEGASQMLLQVHKGSVALYASGGPDGPNKADGSGGSPLVQIEVGGDVLAPIEPAQCNQLREAFRAEIARRAAGRSLEPAERRLTVRVARDVSYSMVREVIACFASGLRGGKSGEDYTPEIVFGMEP
jgi:hypothetical protein